MKRRQVPLVLPEAVHAVFGQSGTPKGCTRWSPPSFLGKESARHPTFIAIFHAKRFVSRGNMAGSSTSGNTAWVRYANARGAAAAVKCWRGCRYEQGLV